MQILYQDEWLIAVNKPAGLLVHRSALAPKSEPVLLQQVRDAVGRRVYALNRLDRPTSGIVVFAFDPTTIAILQQQWHTGVIKQYQALVRGWVTESGFIDYALRYQADRSETRLNATVVAQQASTSYSPMQYFEAPFCSKRYATSRYTMLNLQLHTGRKHQIRRHLAHIRHPIVGDTTHGDGEQNRLARVHLSCQHLLLSCVNIHLIHPHTLAPIVITSPRSNNFDTCLHTLSEYSIDR